ncbi:MAG: hypothetical protein Q7R95_05525, partial [bacterium]|nr:hypothetical protein [bacterium]
EEGIRQEHPQSYVLTGACYVSKVADILKYNKILGGRIYGFDMPQNRSIDIDTEEDFLNAEFVIEQENHFFNNINNISVDVLMNAIKIKDIMDSRKK